MKSTAQALIEVDGKRYMSTKSAAELWGLSAKTVSDYCKDGRITNCFKNGGYGWYILENEMKPLGVTEIRKLLTITIQLKNNPSYEIDWSLLTCDERAISLVYRNLQVLGYIEPFSIDTEKRIPYEVILTQKGIDLITDRGEKSRRKKETDITSVVTQWIPIIIAAAQLYFQIHPTLV